MQTATPETMVIMLMFINRLWAEITNYRNLASEAVQQANNAIKVFTCLNDTLWQNRFLCSKESKVTIYEILCSQYCHTKQKVDLTSIRLNKC